MVKTEFNIEKKVTGTTDIPLNSKGREQALEIGESLSIDSIDTIFSSPLIRAKETAEIISNHLDLSYSIDERLREIDMGIFQGVEKSVIYSKQGDLWDLHKKDL